MNAYRAIEPSPYQIGTKVRVIDIRSAGPSVKVGDIGALKYQHYTMIGQMVPAGWVVQFGWHWRLSTLLVLLLDLLFLGWLDGSVLCSHLFDEQLEIIGEDNG